jgi:endonuclease/exonuclease/phosphatase family metal-dependent hydrolase
MARLLFWNAYKSASEDAISQIANIKQVDLVALAEAQHVSDESIQDRLRSRCQRTFHSVPGAFRIRVYSSFPVDYIRVLSDENNIVSLELRQIFAPSILVIFAHLASKMGQDEPAVSMLATRLRSQIEKLETKAGHRRTIVMGDLNMEPYETGVVSSETLHATMCAKIARRRARQVHGEDRTFFYNPMWNLLGDNNDGPPGTFYRSKNDPNARFWHMTDQVLLRPDAIDLVDVGSLGIITKAGELNLATREGMPNRKYSDHFPIFISTKDEANTPEQA